MVVLRTATLLAGGACTCGAVHRRAEIKPAPSISGACVLVRHGASQTTLCSMGRAHVPLTGSIPW